MSTVDCNMTNLGASISSNQILDINKLEILNLGERILVCDSIQDSLIGLLFKCY